LDEFDISFLVTITFAIDKFVSEYIDQWFIQTNIVNHKIRTMLLSEQYK